MTKKKDLSWYQRRVRDLDQWLAEKTRRIEELDDLVTQRQREIIDLRSEVNAKDDQLQREKVSWKDALDVATKEVHALAHKLTEAESRVGFIRRSRERRDMRIRDLEVRLDRANRALVTAVLMEDEKDTQVWEDTPTFGESPAAPPPPPPVSPK